METHEGRWYPNKYEQSFMSTCMILLQRGYRFILFISIFTLNLHSTFPNQIKIKYFKRDSSKMHLKLDTTKDII